MTGTKAKHPGSLMKSLWKYRRGITIFLGGLGILLLYVLYASSTSGEDIMSADGEGGKDDSGQLQQILADGGNDVKAITNDAKIFVIGDSHIAHLKEVMSQGLVKHSKPDLATGHQVTLYGIPGATVDVLRNNQKLIYLLKSERPEVVMLHVGGNDADSNLPVEEIFGNVLKYSIELEAVYGAKRVLVSEQFRRPKPRHMSSKAYDIKIVELNKQLQSHDSKRFWSHVKLMQAKEGFLGEDGVHLNQYGQQYFYESLQDALSYLLTM